MAGDDVLLRCELHSNLATPRWTLNGRELQGYGAAAGYRVGTDGLLIVGARAAQGGTYRCFAVENAIWVPVRQYSVRIHTDPALHAADNADATATAATPSPTPDPTELPADATSGGPTERPLPSPPPPPPPSSAAGAGTNRHMEAVYVSLVAVLGGLCLVLTVVLLYVSCCTAASSRRARRRARKFPQQGLQILGETEGLRRLSSGSPLELHTISGHCNGRLGAARRSDSLSSLDDPLDGFLQIVAAGQGAGQMSPCKTPPPAPPLPPSSSVAAAEHVGPPPPPPEFANGLSATLPSVLRRMNGNSYVLLRQSDAETPVANGYAFNDELSKMLEKRKHTQPLQPRPDESSV